jgi:hypothetical protein
VRACVQDRENAAERGAGKQEMATALALRSGSMSHRMEPAFAGHPNRLPAPPQFVECLGDYHTGGVAQRDTVTAPLSISATYSEQLQSLDRSFSDDAESVVSHFFATPCRHRNTYPPDHARHLEAAQTINSWQRAHRPFGGIE